MADLNSEVARLINTHGVGAVGAAVASAANPPVASAAKGPAPGSLAASYIREIITGDQAFDPGVLAQVSKVLAGGSGGGT